MQLYSRDKPVASAGRATSGEDHMDKCTLIYPVEEFQAWSGYLPEINYARRMEV